MVFEILFLGEHTNSYKDDGTVEIDPLTSAVVLLSDGKHNVLLDTGSVAWRPILIAKLKSFGLDPSDITEVLLTHFHLDHTSNAMIFENAKIYAEKSMSDNTTGRCLIDPRSNFELPCGVKMLKTPGHTPDHVSYLFEVNKTRYCFAGDAVRRDILEESLVPQYFDSARKSEYLESLIKIFESCDVIIPGHFDLIQGEDKRRFEERIAIPSSSCNS